MAGRVGGHGLAGKIQNFVPVNHHNGVPIHEFTDFFTQLQRMHRRRRRIHDLFGFCLRALVVAAQRLNPVGRRLDAVGAFVDQLAQDRFGVAHDADIDRAIAADLFVGNIDLDELHILGKTRRLAKTDNEVKARANHQHHIGFLPGAVPGTGETQGVVFLNHPTALGGGEKRNAAGFDKLLEFGHGARPEQPGAGQDQRTLGASEQADGLADQVRVGGDTGNRVWPLDKRRFLFLNLAIQHVARQIEIHRSRLAAGRNAKCLVHKLWDTPGIFDPLGPLGDGFEHADLVHFLEGAHAVLRNRARPTQGNHRNRVQKGIPHPGDQVRHARS